jgi:histidinol phosphatase-like PHP family hydrolase
MNSGFNQQLPTAMQRTFSRRNFLKSATTATCALGALPEAMAAAENTRFEFPLVDFHVHLDNSAVEQVLELSVVRGIKFGIVEHAGTKENVYPVVLSNDDELVNYLQRLEGKPVFKGVQAEWTDWMSCFSRPRLAQLDYVLTDAMTFPGRDGQRVKLWEAGVEQRVDLTDKQKWMDRFVEWHVEIMSKQPIDILANTSWLPAPLAGEYDTYWTPERVKRVVEAAVAHEVALEISSGFKLPKLSFLEIAKTLGAKFSLGSNGRYPNMGKLDYALEMARALKLTKQDLFTPGPAGRKAVQRRKF